MIVASRTGLRLAAPTVVRSFGTSGVLAAARKKESAYPSAPKGSPSAYTLFVKDWFSKNRDSATDPSTGKISITKLANEMGQAWNALEATAKETFNDTARKLRGEWDKEYRSWYDSLSPDAIKAIEKETGKKISPPGGKKKYKSELAGRAGNPGRPVTAFFEFMREFRNSAEVEGVEASEGIKAVASRAGAKWRDMSDSEKQRYRDIAADRKSKFEEWMKTQPQQGQ